MTAPSAAADTEGSASPLDRAVPTALRRPVAATVVLLGCYVLLSLLVDPGGFLGTDTGGKVATIEAMADGADGPDVGYWAAEADAEAEHHGLYYTERIGDRFVNVTTLPMIYAALPLYEVGGYRGALVIPMLGAAAAALAARAIARTVGGDGSAAFWLTGLASPVCIYALDLWEHSLGLAFMAWGVVAVLVALERPFRWWTGIVAGLLFGAAFSMRTEALAYGFTTVAVGLVVLAARTRSVRAPLGLGLGALGGLVVAAALNAGLEVAVLGETFRTGRASGAAGRAGLGGLAARVEEGIVTLAGLRPSLDRADLVLGLLLAGLLVGAAYVSATRGRSSARAVGLLAAASAALYLVRLLDGPGFVPGMLAATPLAAAGLAAAAYAARTRIVVAMAVVALPVVWLFQFAGGAAPQWGGRYVLTSGLLLASVGIATAGQLAPGLRRYFVAAAVVVTAFGFAWQVERSHGVAAAAADVADRDDPVLISDVQFWLRELAVAYPGSRWLTVPRDGRLEDTVAVAEAAGHDRFALLQLDEGSPPDVDGYDEVSTVDYRWLDVPFRITTYAASGS